jgi:hypothetical protein
MDIPSRAPRVFISYRRDDSAAYAGLLYQDLSGRTGSGSVLMDADLGSALATCDAVLVVIGPSWLSSQDPGGGRAIDNPRDPVRTEVEQALTSGRLVIPVLVGGAIAPLPDELPAPIADLATRQGFELSDTRWGEDVAVLADWIQGAILASVGAGAAGVVSAPRISPTNVPASPEKKWDTRRTSLTIGPIALVIVVVLVLIVVSAVNKPAAKKQIPPIPHSAQSSLLAKVVGVPESVFAQVGLPSAISNPPTKLTGKIPLTQGGLPVMLFVGAEYCPFCAAERWAMVMALSKFGSFTNLATTSSSSTDFAPDTPTFTFYKSTYKSNYLVFQPYEVATNMPAAPGSTCNVNGYACLETSLPKVDYDAFQTIGQGSFPFIDFSNKVVQSGAGFEDQPLALANLTWDEVASQLYQPSTAVAQAEDGSANYLTAAICEMTGNQPSAVCSAPYVSQAQEAFGS